MKDQYVGDINDYRKYAILRTLTGDGGFRAGVCWMRTPPDGRSDGRMIEYLAKPEAWRSFDPPLFDLLKEASRLPDWRRLALIEESGAIPGAVYQNDVVPSGLAPRAAYLAESMRTLSGCDLVFFDPDNGLDVPSVGPSQRDAPKFVYLAEVAAAYDAGHSVLFYQHFPRVPRDAFVDRVSDRLKRQMPAAAQWVFRTAHVAFFLLARPEHAAAIATRIAAGSALWTDRFITVGKLDAGASDSDRADCPNDISLTTIPVAASASGPTETAMPVLG
ncbi:hypothetical protein Q8W71_31800 [Methylobacterium sp. NEAU 140]|uniref:hypothetical protein n=1 Tax=Methylobacterium sp. NEAU 140 TaxID=3064945 RepID=UPI002734DABF|nr:hypothetical protein [Methylobacterium sp. NEAU 140]MDP4027165.1 hypothetical protein [Methylobacterium sp. NEAU 140]